MEIQVFRGGGGFFEPQVLEKPEKDISSIESQQVHYFH